MCGIAGIYLRNENAIGPKRLQLLTDELLRAIDDRGGDATGFAAFTPGMPMQLQKASCDAYKFLKHRAPLNPGTRAVLLHTRFATQGPEEFPENNHPVVCGDTYAVHNGHVWNDDDVIATHGYPRVGEVDSEAIVHAVEGFGWENLATPLESLEGGIATALLHAVTGELALARVYQSPLVYIESVDWVIFASTQSALTRAWSKVLGTPPKAKRFNHLKEGFALRYTIDGAYRVDPFTPYDPPVVKYTSARSSQWSWSTERYDSWKKEVRNGTSTYIRETADYLGAAAKTTDPDADAGGGNGDEEETYTPSSYLADCDCCGDAFPASDVWEIYPGFMVCPACEVQLERGTARIDGLREVHSRLEAPLYCLPAGTDPDEQDDQ